MNPREIVAKPGAPDHVPDVQDAAILQPRLAILHADGPGDEPDASGGQAPRLIRTKGAPRLASRTMTHRPTGVALVRSVRSERVMHNIARMDKTARCVAAYHLHWGNPTIRYPLTANAPRWI
jgi:hypothetical protein